MFKQIAKRLASQHLRSFSTSKPNNFHVTLCGASGGIGQPLSLLLKLNPLITKLYLYDVVGTHGVAADLSHIDTGSSTKSALGPEKILDGLKGADLVLVTAGVPRKPGMDRDDLFNLNAGIVRDIAKAVSKSCPKALFAVITNPVNSTVPIVAEVLKKLGTYDPKRLFGVTTLDLVRSRTFIGEELHTDPKGVNIPVIGGHSGFTIIPVLSQCNPKYSGKAEAIIKRIQDAGTEVVKAKAGAGSATLSMAYAASLMACSLLKGLNGEKNIVECAYVESKVTEAAYFASPLSLGKNGIEKNFGLPKLNGFEENLLKTAIPELKKDIQKGVDYAKKS